MTTPTLREAAQSVVDTKDWQGLYFALADLRAALATPEPDVSAMLAERDRLQARADAAEAECARLRDKYASGTFCPGCDHQRLARYEAEAARDRLQADLARAIARAEAWRTFATHMAECKSGCCELGAVLWNDARRLEEWK